MLEKGRSARGKAWLRMSRPPVVIDVAPAEMHV